MCLSVEDHSCIQYSGVDTHTHTHTIYRDFSKSRVSSDTAGYMYKRRMANSCRVEPGDTQCILPLVRPVRINTHTHTHTHIVAAAGGEALLNLRRIEPRYIRHMPRAICSRQLTHTHTNTLRGLHTHTHSRCRMRMHITWESLYNNEPRRVNVLRVKSWSQSHQYPE